MDLVPLRAFGTTLAYVFKHPVGRRHPLRTLARVVAWQIRLRMRPGLQVAPWVGGSKLLVRRSLTGVTGNVYYGLHEFVGMSFVALLLRRGDLFADVGANAGTYTVLASRVAGARSVAFEPGQEAAAILGDIVRLNGIEDTVTVRREAVGDRVGEARFTKGLGTMNRIADEGAIAVPMTTLDAAFANDQPTVIKIDIEGGEDRCVAGARHVLSDARLQALLIETVSEEAGRILADAGLTEVQFDPWTRALYDGPPRHSINNLIYVRDRAFVAERLRSAPPLTVTGLTL